MSDGRIDVTGADGGRSSHYSRRSLMTFAFLEMLTQANTKINSEPYRTDVGWKTVPRKIKRIIITCPTAMSKIEREALVKCAKDAVTLYGKFVYGNAAPVIDIIPAVRSMKDNDGSWYYDEATCAQLVYIYGEVGHKYKGVCSEFFNLYGKTMDGNPQPTLTVGSLDIGAGIGASEYTTGLSGMVLTPAIGVNVGLFKAQIGYHVQSISMEGIGINMNSIQLKIGIML
jgi:hypothetical protein